MSASRRIEIDGKLSAGEVEDSVGLEDGLGAGEGDGEGVGETVGVGL